MKTAGGATYTTANGHHRTGMQERILNFEEALAEVLAHATPLLLRPREEEYVSLLESQGRPLAFELRADRDQPPFPRSTRDGYALWSGDPAWKTGTFQIIGSIRAGERWTGADLCDGEAIEIMTGAPVPPGADAVLMLEHAVRDGNELRPLPDRALRQGENVVPQGAEAQAFSTVLPAGRRIGTAEIGVMASVGEHTVAVTRKPRVAIVATGDELVELAATPEDWQIRNSNSDTLSSLVSHEGGHPARLQIARDTRKDLFERIAQGSMFDLLLLSGGVSMGKYDLVEPVLKEFGAEFFFTGALIQPGKPVVFGRLPKAGTFQTDENGRPFIGPHDLANWAGEWTYFFGLPGNPVSTQVCFQLFVTPLLRALSGRNDLAPQFVEARLVEDVKGGAKVTRFLPAQLTGDWKGVFARLVGWQGSGDVTANARGNCYAVLPAGISAFSTGETIRVLLRD